MKIENWSLVSVGSPYRAPELLEQYLHGNIYGHPRFEDGDEVTTSHIISKSGGEVITASGSVYKLGEVSADYLDKYPNANEVLK